MVHHDHRQLVAQLAVGNQVFTIQFAQAAMNGRSQRVRIDGACAQPGTMLATANDALRGKTSEEVARKFDHLFRVGGGASASHHVHRSGQRQVKHRRQSGVEPESLHASSGQLAVFAQQSLLAGTTLLQGSQLAPRAVEQGHCAACPPSLPQHRRSADYWLRKATQRC